MPTASVKLLSRRHARIFYEQGDIYLVDLGSRNGTRLNGQQLAGQPQRLMHGDEILFGNLAYHLLQDTECTDKNNQPAADAKTEFLEEPTLHDIPGAFVPEQQVAASSVQRTTLPRKADTISNKLCNEPQVAQAADHETEASDNSPQPGSRTRSPVNWLMPDWLESLQAGDYVQAFGIIEGLHAGMSTAVDVEHVVAILRWATALEQLVADRLGG